MNKIRKVINGLIVVLFFGVILTNLSCSSQEGFLWTAGGDSLPPSLQEVRDNQECCFMEYGVKDSIEGHSQRVSRESAVKIHVQAPGGRYRGTGTYFKYRGHHIVVTAAHLWAEGPPTVLTSEALITSPLEKVVGKLVYWDPYVDIAILVTPELGSRTPAKFVRDPEYSVGETVVYSGFPGRNSLLTFEGEIAGDGYGTDLAMHSLAWGGSSGSGVFDTRGRFVGVVSSIMVGRGFFGPTLVGSIVYVAPANLIDMQYVRQNIRTLEKRKNDGF